MSADRDLSPRVQAEAAAWLARLHADDRSLADEKGFQSWIGESSAHMAAFDVVTATWEAAGAAARRVKDAKQNTLRNIRRRAVLGGIGTLAVAGATFSVWRSAQAGIYETDVGEQKHIILQDGSYAFLDTSTCIKVDFNDRFRNVDLERGRANFRVAPDPKRPFVVDAADRKISAFSSDFDVSRSGDDVSVVLVAGLVTVAHGGAVERMQTGQRLVTGPARSLKIDRPNLRPLLAWQTGQAIFENETLAQAVAEMNRYSSVNLELADPAIGKLRLSGVYRVGDIAAFAYSVSHLLPVSVREAGGHMELVADQKRSTGG
jgi:transmembrane sensor